MPLSNEVGCGTVTINQEDKDNCVEQKQGCSRQASHRSISALQRIDQKARAEQDQHHGQHQRLIQRLQQTADRRNSQDERCRPVG